MQYREYLQLTFLMCPKISVLPRLMRDKMTLLFIDSMSCAEFSCGTTGTTNNGNRRITYAVIWKP